MRDSFDLVVEGWRSTRDDLDVSAVEVVARLGRVRAIIEQSMEALLAEHGLTVAGFSALAAVARLEGEDGVTQVRLMRELRLTSGTVSVRVDRLVADGLTERGPDPEDRRGTRIRLTAKGREVFERAAPAHLANERRLLAALAPDDRDRLAALLRTLLIDLDGPAPGTPDPAAALGVRVAAAHETAAMRQAMGLPDRGGLLVRSVEPGGPASRAGVLTGDVLTAVGDHEVHSLVDVGAAVAAEGADAPLTVVRGNRRITLAASG